MAGGPLAPYLDAWGLGWSAGATKRALCKVETVYFASNWVFANGRVFQRIIALRAIAFGNTLTKWIFCNGLHPISLNLKFPLMLHSAA
jgi:hypothetical protein